MDETTLHREQIRVRDMSHLVNFFLIFEKNLNYYLFYRLFGKLKVQ